MSRLVVLLLLLPLACRAAAGNMPSMEPSGRAAKYVIGFGSNYPKRTPILQLFISTLEPFPVSFEVVSLLGFSYQGKVMPDSTVNVTIPTSYELTTFSEREKGISITTDNGTIIVHGMNYYNTTTDGFLALPCTPLDIDNYEYYGLTYHDDSLSSPGFLLIVGCDDNTVVNHGSSTTTINKMETLYLQDFIDFSGARVKSSKPISFFAGHACTNVPSSVRACDHLVEQIPPTAVWGTHFLSASYFNRSSPELYRILTASNFTTVVVNCNTFSKPQTFCLSSAGSWTEFLTSDNSYCSIESNNPLLVMEFSLGNAIDLVGGPFMMMIPSVDQYTNDYVFHASTEFSNYITILVTPQYYQPEQVLVDGVSQENANWEAVPCADGSVCGYCAYVTLEPGDHHVWHSDSCAKISVLMYGFTDDVSYGQPAGLFYAHYRIPSNFSHTVVEGDPHSVRFTWSPPPEQEQSGEITHYTIVCTSEHGGNDITVNKTGLETNISSFASATHYWCSVSATTTCHGEGLYSHAVHLLTIPDAVKNLTVRFTNDELILLWTGGDGVISHYIVTVHEKDNVLFQLSVSQQHLIISKATLGSHGALQVSVSAANDAGIGLPGVAFSEQPNQSGESGKPISVIGGAVAAAIVLLTLVVVTFIIVVRMKRKICCQTLTKGNNTQGRNTVVSRTPSTNDNVAYVRRNVIHVTNQHWLDFSPPSTMAQEPPPLPPRIAPTGIAENNTDGELSDAELDYLYATI